MKYLVPGQGKSIPNSPKQPSVEAATGNHADGINPRRGSADGGRCGDDQKAPRQAEDQNAEPGEFLAGAGQGNYRGGQNANREIKPRKDWTQLRSDHGLEYHSGRAGEGAPLRPFHSLSVNFNFLSKGVSDETQ